QRQIAADRDQIERDEGKQVMRLRHPAREHVAENFTHRGLQRPGVVVVVKILSIAHGSTKLAWAHGRRCVENRNGNEKLEAERDCPQPRLGETETPIALGIWTGSSAKACLRSTTSVRERRDL